ncbi:MAG: hypothetical protein J7K58_03880 [Euryarchaeota archaeon]|nr:hypothetical protein [Euryarchaeota archaeon]
MVRRVAAEYLLKILGGPKTLYASYRVRARSLVNRLSNDILVGRAFLVEEHRYGKLLDKHLGLSIIGSKGNIESDLMVTRNNSNNVIKIDTNFEEIEGPRIVVDVRYYDLHKSDEKMSLIEQMRLITVLLRDYLTEGHYIVTSANEHFMKDFLKGNYDFRGKIHEKRFNEILNKEETIVLDPFGDIEFDASLFKEYKYFVIGGIVDRGCRFQGFTSRMAEDFERARISLKGDIKGVPDRINRIAEILIYLYCGVASTIEEAIKLAQAPIVARKRLPIELKRRAIRFEMSGRRWYAIALSDYEELHDIMNFRDSDIERVLDRDLIVITDELYERIISSKSFESFGRVVYIPEGISEDFFRSNIVKVIGKSKEV